MLLRIPGWLFILLSIISIPLQAAPDTRNPVIDLKFVTIPTGQFIMGTADLSEALADLPTPDRCRHDRGRDTRAYRGL